MEKCLELLEEALEELEKSDSPEAESHCEILEGLIDDIKEDYEENDGEEEDGEEEEEHEDGKEKDYKKMSGKELEKHAYNQMAREHGEKKPHMVIAIGIGKPKK